ncbi:MAG TPA: polysaccharide deacetylase family protein [Pyrinomonadaceae bacterium]
MSNNWKWPGDAEAAISLSYDDGRGSHLDHVVPDLDRAGFRGTFYLTINSAINVTTRVREWQDVFERGHEIGNHTMNHPCSNDSDANLKDYTPSMIQAEVRDAAMWLDQNIGRDEYRTFAYPCGELGIGDQEKNTYDGDAYANAVQAYHFAARLANGSLNDPAVVAQNPLRIGAIGIYGEDIKPCLNHFRQTIAIKGWAVLFLHDVGTSSQHGISRNFHREILQHLQGKEYWVAPVKEVAKYIVDSLQASRAR